METKNEEKDPLDYLPEKEADAVAGVIAILEAVISNEDLQAKLIGSLLVEIEEWGESQPKAH